MGHQANAVDDAIVIGALRLAMEASVDNDVQERLINELLSNALETDPSDIASVKLFFEAIKAVDGEIVVTAGAESFLRSSAKVKQAS